MLAALNSNRWMQREPPPTLLQLLQGRKQVNFRHGMGTLLNKLHRRSVRKWEKKGGGGWTVGPILLGADRPDKQFKDMPIFQ